MSNIFTDLHCHILPYIDDGPDSVEKSVQLIRLQQQDGVNIAIASPHFYPEEHDFTEFIEKREAAFEKLRPFMSEFDDFKIKIAAEVMLHPKLLSSFDLKELCIEDTNFMLTELPWDYWPEWVSDVLYGIRLAGVTPIIVHAEKYTPILKKPSRLYELVSTGVLVQVNASSVVNSVLRKKVFDFIKHRLVHFIATDTHSVNNRPPQLSMASKIIGKNFGNDLIQYFSDNANSVINNITPEIYEPIAYKKRMFG